MRDLHQGLKTDIIATARAPEAGVEFVTVRHQWGKEEFDWSVHAFPNTWTSAGLQTTDLLGLVKFDRSSCAFRSGQECYFRSFNEKADLRAFADAFDAAYAALLSAEKSLVACGFLLPQAEGWGYFSGRSGRSGRAQSRSTLGDGHTAAKHELMKSAEDGVFRFAFTWVATSNGAKGWVTHFGIKNPPPSVELTAVLDFLELKEFENCPEFGFDGCFWRALDYEAEESPFNRSTSYAHRSFDALGAQFSPGIEQLLKSHALFEPFGIQLLPLGDRSKRQNEEIHRRTSKTKVAESSPVENSSQMPDKFDVAISFAGTERSYAEQLAHGVREAGFAVFYDNFYPEELWGKNLVEFFHEVYSKRARYCVMFVSSEYATRDYTVYERRSAQERMLREKGKEYILPIQVDATELPGLVTTVAYLPIAIGIDRIAEVLIRKLRGH